MNPTSYIMSNMVSGYGLEPIRQKRNAIPPLKNPVMLKSCTAAPDDWVIGFMLDGVPTAVPVKIMETHEVVQLKNKGRWITLTYCPLTKSAVTYYNLWGTSGLLYNSNVVLFSENDGISLMPQILGKIVNGDRFDNTVPRMRVYQTTRYAWESVFPNTLWIQGITGVKYVEKYAKYNDASKPAFPVMYLPPPIQGRNIMNPVVGFNLNGNNYCVFEADVGFEPIFIRNIDNVTVYGSVEAPDSIKIQRNNLGCIDIIYKGQYLNAIQCLFFAWYANFPTSYIVNYNLEIIESMSEIFPWMV